MFLSLPAGSLIRVHVQSANLNEADEHRKYTEIEENHIFTRLHSTSDELACQ